MSVKNARMGFVEILLCNKVSCSPVYINGVVSYFQTITSGMAQNTKDDIVEMSRYITVEWSVSRR